MPRKPAKKRIGVKKLLPDYLRKHLEKGVKPKAGEAGCFDILMIDLDKAWSTHNKAILATWITERPFSRPWAFWECSTPETRKQISGKKISEKWPGDICYNFGLPVYSASYALGQSNNKINPDDFESELQYLKRLNLLTDSEKKLLKHNI